LLRLAAVRSTPAERYDDQWKTMYERLKEYQSIYGDCRVPVKYQPDPQLRYWVVNQRARYQNLSEERRQRLDEIGFVFLAPREKWDLMFQRLVDYQLQHGDCRVPAKYQPDPQLAWWVVNQRAKYQNLSVEQRQRLDDIGFVLGMPTTERWDSMFERLRDYQSINGHCAVPARYSLDPQLGHWVINQRAKYQNLSEERRQCLDDIGFVPGMTVTERWDLMFQLLVDYKLKHGDCCVPVRYQPDLQLGHWVMTQRRATKYQNLSVEQRQRLDDIGFVPGTPMTERWDSMFERLRNYQSINGHCAVPTKYSLDPQLGSWVVNQRAKYLSLSEERRQHLDDIGFVPGMTVTERWDSMLERLREYQSINGHCAVPARYSLDPQLGLWVINQRAKYQNLSEERRQRLEDIGFVARLRKQKTRAMGLPCSNGSTSGP
jgi:Helicase associated domain